MIHVLKDKTLVDCFHLNVAEFQVGNSAFPRGQAHAARGEESRWQRAKDRLSVQEK